MKKPKNNLILALLFLILIFYVCFYQMERNEIGDVYIIRVLGIDHNEDGYTVTALYNVTGSSSSDSEDGGGGGSMDTLDGRGDTVYMAFENMKKKSPCNMTIAHTSFYLLSESAANSGVEGCLDYVSRDQTVKTNASVYLLQSDNVNSFLTTAVDEEFFVSENLDNLTIKQANQLSTTENSILNILNNLKDQYSSLLIPYLIYEDNCLYPGGYAVFKKDIFYQYLDYDTSMALDLLRSRLRSYPIYLDNGVGLEVTDYKVFITASNVEQNPIVHVTMDVSSNIREISGDNKSIGNEELEKLQKLQGKYLLEKIKNVISISKKINVDLLEVKRVLANESGEKWSSIEKNWDAYFKSITYDFQIENKISKNNVII